MNGRGVKEEAAAVFSRIREGGAVDADHSAIGEHLGTAELKLHISPNYSNSGEPEQFLSYLLLVSVFVLVIIVILLIGAAPSAVNLILLVLLLLLDILDLTLYLVYSRLKERISKSGYSQ